MVFYEIGLIVVAFGVGYLCGLRSGNRQAAQIGGLMALLKSELRVEK